MRDMIKICRVPWPYSSPIGQPEPELWRADYDGATCFGESKEDALRKMRFYAENGRFPDTYEHTIENVPVKP